MDQQYYKMNIAKSFHSQGAIWIFYFVPLHLVFAFGKTYCIFSE